MLCHLQVTILGSLLRLKVYLQRRVAMVMWICMYTFVYVSIFYVVDVTVLVVCVVV